MGSYGREEEEERGSGQLRKIGKKIINWFKLGILIRLNDHVPCT